MRGVGLTRLERPALVGVGSRENSYDVKCGCMRTENLARAPGHESSYHLWTKFLFYAASQICVGRGPGEGKLAPEFRPLIRCRIRGPGKPNSAPLENKVGEWVVEE